MTKLAVLFAVAVALASPGIAQAASPDGDHVFTGTVQIRKNLPVWVTCSMTAVINVTAAVPTLKSVAVAGSGACATISFFSLPSAPFVPGPPPLFAAPARGDTADQNMIAGRESRYARPDAIDDADSLMPEDAAGRAARDIAFQYVEVGAANGRLGHADDRVARIPHLGDRPLLYSLQARAVIDEGFHSKPPFVRGSASGALPWRLDRIGTAGCEVSAFAARRRRFCSVRAAS